MDSDLYLDLPPVLDVKQTAEVIGCSTDTVRVLVAEARLGSIRVGRLVKIPRHSLAAFLHNEDTAAVVESVEVSRIGYLR